MTWADQQGGAGRNAGIGGKKNWNAGATFPALLRTFIRKMSWIRGRRETRCERASDDAGNVAAAQQFNPAGITSTIDFKPHV